MRKLLLAFLVLAWTPAWGQSISGNGGGISGNTVGSGGSIIVPNSPLLGGNAGALLPAIPGTDYLAPNSNGSGLTGLTWSQIGSTPTTLGGYGIGVTGTGTAVQATSPVLVTPNLGTPSAANLANAMGYLASALTGSTLPSGVTSAPGLATLAGGAVGTAAFAATGTSGATVPLLNGTNTWANPQSFLGLLTTAGISDTAGINTTAASGYSQNSNPLARYVGTIGSNPANIFGTGAGTAVTTGGGLFSAFFGDQVGHVYTGGGEVAGFGPLTMANLTTGAQDAAFGVGAMWWATTDSLDACFGSDTCRNTIGQNSVAAFGHGAAYNMFAGGISAFGESSLAGNAQSLMITGTPAAGETWSGTLTLTGVSGSPFSWTYTTVSGDSVLGTLATHLCGVMNYNGLPVGSYQCNPSSVTLGGVLTGVLQFTFDGTSTQGNIIALTATSTGAEVLTIGGGSVGVQNDCYGYHSCQGTTMTSAANNVGFGHNVLQWITTASANACGGYQSCEFLTTGAENSAWGFENLSVATTAFGNTTSGWEAGVAVTVAQNNGLYGIKSGLLLTSGNNNDLFGRQTGAALTSQSGNSFFGDQSGLHATSNFGSFYGLLSGGSVTTGFNNSIFGYSVASTTLTIGSNNLIEGTSAACDTPTASASAMIIICGSAGPVWTATATGTPSTSVTTIAGLTTFGGQITLASATTGSSTPAWTNSPCTTSATTAQWIPISITGQSGTFYVPACH